MIDESVPLELDVRGLSCPMPLLRARKALAGLGAGALLRVRVSDPQAPADFEAYCRDSGHQLLEVQAEAGEWILLLSRRN
ncbi:MAG: sulfurtransferase TusA family protein [Halothiobacillaceae bacterium]|jgi:tRNA 2-thiouridine synthesizing protein A|nr:sulfurtransferase TusA family protein [Halothiobacillaceae bacterium]MDY0049170.1 sulfurtransferase TusA family protein [Halothiobacillaceae bacterium]